jgi:hypothetical protein
VSAAAAPALGNPLAMGIESAGLIAGVVSNLASCGTITQVGCVKTADTKAQIAASKYVILAVYTALDEGNPSAAAQYLEAAAKEVQAAGQSMSSVIGQGGMCSPTYLPIPAASKTAALLCGGCFSNCPAAPGTLHSKMTWGQWFAWAQQIIQSGGGLGSTVQGTAATSNLVAPNAGDYALATLAGAGVSPAAGTAAKAPSAGKTIAIVGIGVGLLGIAAKFL